MTVQPRTLVNDMSGHPQRTSAKQAGLGISQKQTPADDGERGLVAIADASAKLF